MEEMGKKNVHPFCKRMWLERKKKYSFIPQEREIGRGKKKKFQQFQKRKRLEEEKNVEIKIINCSLISKKRKFDKHVSRSLRKYEIIDF